MSCEACITSAKAQREQYETTLIKAKEYAIQHQTDVAIYREAYLYAYIEATAAAGLNIVEYVSFHT